MRVGTRRVMEAVGEAAAEKRRELFEDVEPAETREEFELASGPLGHLQDNALDEGYFSAARWEAFFEDIADPDLVEDLQSLPIAALAKAPTALQQAFDI